MSKEQNSEKKQQSANNKKNTSEFSLEAVVTNAVKIPGVKVKRNEFLAKTFSDHPELITEIVDENPIDAGISRELLMKKAKQLIAIRTSESSFVSFLAGIPGGIAMAATVPTDVLQFFGMTLRLAQELSYLYGAKDIWENGVVDDEKVRNQLILYCGVMFGVSGAAAGVRVLSTQIAKTTLKKLPQKALTKTFWYPLVKKIAAAIGYKITKTTVAQGISKAVPVVGGVISGGLNFASMLPMANRLLSTLDKSAFEYTEEDLEADYIEIEKTQEEGAEEPENKNSSKETIKDITNKSAKAVSSTFSGLKNKIGNTMKAASEKKQSEDAFKALKKLQELEELGAITEEELNEKKQGLLEKI